MTTLPGQSFGILASALVFVIVAALVRSRRLSEKLSLFWMTFVLLMLGASSFGYPYLIQGAKLIGIAYPPSALFLMAILFLLAYTLYLSISISSLGEHNRRLAQEVALLSTKLDRMHPLSGQLQR